MRVISSLVREESFTWTPLEGEGFTIAVTSLTQAIQSLPVIRLSFPEQTLDELIEQHGLEKERMASMTLAEAMTPVVVIEHGFKQGKRSHILADGGHRRAFFVMNGLGNSLPGRVVPEDIWRMFVIDPSAPGVFIGDQSLLPQRQKK